MNLFESKVRYETIDESTGKDKTVTETYLIDAVSHGEAEARMHKEMQTAIRGEFVVKTVRKVNYTEVLDRESGDMWYKAKISFMSVCEKSGKEKPVSNNILVMADTVKEAYDNIMTGLGGMVVDFSINSISESPILDFFKYDLAKAAATMDYKSQAIND